MISLQLRQILSGERASILLWSITTATAWPHTNNKQAETRDVYELNSGRQFNVYGVSFVFESHS